jgi:hypothetical protein
MKSIVNTRKLSRRATLSNIGSIGGLMILLASVVLPLFKPGMIQVAYILMVVGLGVSMTGIYFANRWVKKPRPETGLDAALKALSNAHRLYHYPSLPGDHILLAPNGVMVLETVNLGSKFIYKNGRGREMISIGRALRYIVEEHLGNPIQSAQAAAVHLERMLGQALGEDVKVPVKPVVVFTHPLAIVEAEDPPIPVCKLDKLKKHVQLPGPRLEQAVYDQIAAFLDGKI